MRCDCCKSYFPVLAFLNDVIFLNILHMHSLFPVMSNNEFNIIIFIWIIIYLLFCILLLLIYVLFIVLLILCVMSLEEGKFLKIISSLKMVYEIVYETNTKELCPKKKCWDFLSHLLLCGTIRAVLSPIVMVFGGNGRHAAVLHCSTLYYIYETVMQSHISEFLFI